MLSVILYFYIGKAIVEHPVKGAFYFNKKLKIAIDFVMTKWEDVNIRLKITILGGYILWKIVLSYWYRNV